MPRRNPDEGLVGDAAKALVETRVRLRASREGCQDEMNVRRSQRRELRRNLPRREVSREVSRPRGIRIGERQIRMGLRAGADEGRNHLVDIRDRAKLIGHGGLGARQEHLDEERHAASRERSGAKAVAPHGASRERRFSANLVFEWRLRPSRRR